jgi:hypothetical protein
MERRKDLTIGALIALLVGIALATGFPWWFRYVGLESSSSSEIVGFTGGCSNFVVFAQNVWKPSGAAIRSEPNVTSTQEGSYDGNARIVVNGWVYSRPAYPTNVAPFNSGIWYHLSDGAGWVSFPGVRATKTSPDPTGGYGLGGPPAPAPKGCQGAIQ